MKDVTVTDPGVVKRAVGAAMVGNITEWYDFGVFANLEATLGDVFLSPAGDTMKTIGTAILFAIAFTVRPFGGLFFGPLGDRIGRTKVLAITVILMASATFLIAFIPDYNTIGMAAPLLMVFLRLVQGFSTGGEYAGAMTFIAEYAPDKRRGFFGSFLEYGTAIGYLMGAIMSLGVSLMPHDFVMSWGWRIPFLVAGPIGLIGLYLRMKLEETPAFQAVAKESEAREGSQSLKELKEIAIKFWKPILICGGLVVCWNGVNYVLTTTMPAYFNSYNKPITENHVSEYLQIGSLAIMLFIIPFIGKLSDKIGRKPVMFTGVGLIIVLAIPSTLLTQSTSVPMVAGGMVMMTLMLLCFNSTSPSTLPSLFPTEVRYGGLSVAFNISISAFCGTATVIITSLIAATGDHNWPGYYLIFVGVLGLVALFFMKESANRPMQGTPPAVATEEEARELVEASQRAAEKA
ncbi:MFS transporter [Sciscionella sediminilitoris]|uniref:MFS transporter n=1 Tax=Sciscionella sediminilitoris TaxID=1445613 RepID=UPI0004DEFCEC